MSEKFVSYVDAINIVRRPHESDEQVQKRLRVGCGSGKVYYRYDEERAAAWLDAAVAEKNALMAAEINTLIARHKAPDISDAEFKEGVRKKLLAQLTNLAVVKFMQFERGSLLQWSSDSFGEPDPTHLKQAKPADILKAARAVYADPKNNNPNKTDAEPLVKQWLATQGLKATRNQIRPKLNGKEFASRRNKVGVRKRH
jgi:hypothetical protein